MKNAIAEINNTLEEINRVVTTEWINYLKDRIVEIT